MSFFVFETIWHMYCKIFQRTASYLANKPSNPANVGGSALMLLLLK